MRHATPIALILLCLAGALGASTESAQARGPVTATETKPRQDSGGEGDRAPTQVAAASPSSRGGDKRRISYASCNRESHRRNLSGGKRRRFLIRCKLGYERRQAPRSGEPAPSGRRP